ncbi:hypothetical protein JOD27_002363 [Lentzea nigeriaca]|nr:hypothetical protein [Lentzea nigeriaca]
MGLVVIGFLRLLALPALAADLGSALCDWAPGPDRGAF